MSALLAGMAYYAREVSVALSSVRQEAADSRFMDLSTDCVAEHDEGLGLAPALSGRPRR